MSINQKCTVLVNTCDTYKDLWNPFFTLFKKYWKDCPFRIILNTESKEYIDDEIVVESFKFYHDGEKNYYGERIKKHIEQIETPYTIILLDDFFIRNTVNQSFIEKIIGYLDANPDIVCFNFDVESDPYDIDDGKFEGFARRSRYGEYKYNMQAGIWRTDELHKAWKKKESPWQWEQYGNARAWDDKKRFYIIKDLKDSPIDYGYKTEARGVYRGKWVLEDVAPLFEENGIVLDYNERGIYSKESECSTIQNVSREREYSYGFKRYLRFSLWYVKHKIIEKIAHKQVKYNYSEDLNKKYYDK